MDLDYALEREWLETNGIGGYASSTLACLNTRRYHGLLVAATRPPVGRMVLLSKLEETLVIGERRYELSANRYPGAVHPQGYAYLKEFRRIPNPVMIYEVEGGELEKSIAMVQGENTTVIRYQWHGTQAARLELRPLIAFRDYHSTTHENPAINPALEIGPDYVKVAPYQGVPDLYLHHDGAEVRAAAEWYRNFEYDRERERGLDDKEDLFHPFDLVFANATCTVVASTSGRPSSLAAPSRGDQGEGSTGRRAAAQFIVRRGDQHTIIAGYHWFSDWGRDTMIALPGLTLATGRPDVARSILREFAKHVDRGMLPNRFPDAGEAPEYNTVDATLWFFEAVRALNDVDFARELYPVMADIIDWHERGTRYGIKVDDDGLLQAGEPGVQLTWMDAKVGDWVVTPRHGKPVEIQALWYNALRIMQDLAPGQRRFRDLAERAQRSFLPLFWNDSARCLYDVVNGEQRDAAIRPNQIFAVSLHHTMVPPKQANSVLKTVEQHLLTPYGLRSLAPGDPQYRGRYEGDPWSRDSAYHQGTVWPWLIGPFISAHLAVNDRSEQARQQAEEWLAPLRAYMEERGTGQLPEIFDGDPPHRPCGCIAQAWSVAELLRAEAEIATSTPQATPVRA